MIIKLLLFVLQTTFLSPFHHVNRGNTSIETNCNNLLKILSWPYNCQCQVLCRAVHSVQKETQTTEMGWSTTCFFSQTGVKTSYVAQQLPKCVNNTSHLWQHYNDLTQSGWLIHSLREAIMLSERIMQFLNQIQPSF